MSGTRAHTDWGLPSSAERKPADAANASPAAPSTPTPIPSACPSQPLSIIKRCDDHLNSPSTSRSRSGVPPARGPGQRRRRPQQSAADSKTTLSPHRETTPSGPQIRSPRTAGAQQPPGFHPNRVMTPAAQTTNVHRSSQPGQSSDWVDRSKRARRTRWQSPRPRRLLARIVQ